jgi:hypothetical protein
MNMADIIGEARALHSSLRIRTCHLTLSFDLSEQKLLFLVSNPLSPGLLRPWKLVCWFPCKFSRDCYFPFAVDLFVRDKLIIFPYLLLESLGKL